MQKVQEVSTRVMNLASKANRIQTQAQRQCNNFSFRGTHNDSDYVILFQKNW